MSTFLEMIRKNEGVTQQLLASRLGVTRPTYSKIEKGERDLTLTEARKLAEFYGMRVEDIVQERKKADHQLIIEKDALQEKTAATDMRISVPQENIRKLKEVLLYILEKLGAKPNIGQAVICKLLYFIDFDYYEKYEEQLMGAVYIKNHHGPTPAGFKDILKEMEKNGDLLGVTTKYFQYKQKKYLPRRSADLTNFSGREKELIDTTIERFKDFNAKKMEDYSHRDVPWISAEDQRKIDYEAVFYRTPEFSQRQYEDEV